MSTKHQINQLLVPMKTISLVLLSFVWLTSNLFAGGLVLLGNNRATAVINSLTEAKAVVGNTFQVALYAAIDGTTDETLLVPVGAPTGISPVAGIFTGGVRTAPMVPDGGYGIFQVRIWEAAYGNTYEAAVAAPPANGRGALLGKSKLLRVLTGDPQAIIPATPGNLPAAGLESIVLVAIPVPTLSIDDIVVAEGTNGTKQAVFTVTLLPLSTESVSVEFATADGSALAGSDYVARHGTLVFQPGESSQTISVDVTADEAPEPDEYFTVVLSNATTVIGKAEGECLITEVRLTGIRLDVAVSFNTVGNHVYVLEKSDDMVNWSAVEGSEEVNGTGDIVTVYDRGSGIQSHRTYRARLLR